MRNFKLCIFIIAVFLLNSCATIHRGYSFVGEDIKNLQKAVNNHATYDYIVNNFGTPTYINSPMNDTICYIEANGKRLAFYRFYKPTYKIACVEFNKKGISMKMTYTEVKNVKKAKVLKYKTSFKKLI